MKPEYSTLVIERRGSAEWLTLNRPEVLNALNATMITELHRYFAELEQRRDVRVVVMRGSGRSFCAGLDLKEIGPRLERMDDAAVWAEQRALSRMIVAMRRCPQPIVCLLHGSASGGGFALALASDIRIATPDARMNASFIQVGLSGCDVGVSYHLPRLVGSSIASELLMTGRFLGAERAMQLGLVSDLQAPDAIETAATALVEDLLRAAPLALELTKQGLAASQDAGSLEAAVEVEDRQQALLAVGEEFRARIRGFLAKFAGR
jgi:enoyl-CoA hydratase/carnithine racemase